MTVANHAPALRAPSLAAALGALRTRGMRVSLARRHVLEALYTADGPVTAEALAARIPGADLASVHRNLSVLEEVGLVRHVHLGHGAGRYVLSGLSAEFIACESCGEYEAVAPRRLDAARELIQREFGFVARFTHFPIVGLCVSCKEQHAHS
jgi:Fur family transcriptional regulator, ferric uptake regulator